MLNDTLESRTTYPYRLKYSIVLYGGERIEREVILYADDTPNAWEMALLYLSILDTGQLISLWPIHQEE